MHDPMILLFDVRHPRLDIWHHEPGGADSGTICGLPPARTAGRISWAIQHAHHLTITVVTYRKVRRWIVDRCAHCGERFRWHDSRNSYQGSDQVWHQVCMSLRTTLGHLDDLTAHVRGIADDNTRWRAEYRIKNIVKEEERLRNLTRT
jgi:hypothetical protein